MSRIDRSLGDLGIRLVFGAVPLVICWWIGREESDASMRVFLMFPGLLVAALIVFPSLTSAAGFRVGEIYWPWSDRVKRATPFHAVDGMIYREEWDAAEKELFRLGREFPEDVGVWQRLFEMLWVKIGDRDRAGRAHRRALACIADEASWARVARAFEIHAGRVFDGADLEQALAGVKKRENSVRDERAKRKRVVQGASEGAWRALVGRSQTGLR